MNEKDLKSRLISLKNILREALVLVSDFQIREKETQFDNLFNRSCKLIFDSDFYLNIWDENILLQLGG